MFNRTSLAPWVRGAVLGGALGSVFLGVGGRAAMRGVALAQGSTPGFSPGGSLTVVFLGIVSGIAAGLIYVASIKLAGHRMWLARLLFAIAILGLALRGLRPLDSLRLALFLPLFASFGVFFDRLWARRSNPAGVQSDGAHAT